jgi:2,3-bisphosphoglycerate-independent phosphoglycerate mutase
MKAACICNNAVYNGIGRLLGMDVVHFRHEDNYLDYYRFVEEQMPRIMAAYDFVFLHLQEGDLMGEDGNIEGKVGAIEDIDRTLAFINRLSPDTVIAVTADYSTPCSLREHSGDAVPLAMYGPGCRADRTTAFGERDCAYGSLGILLGKDIMNLMMNLAGKNPLIGG